jgi:hypothetical protein
MAIGEIRCDRCGQSFEYWAILEHHRLCGREPRPDEPEPFSDRGWMDCSHPGCHQDSRGDTGLCAKHGYEERNPGRTYDPFLDYPASPNYDTDRNPEVPPVRGARRAVFPNFSKSGGQEERRSSSRSAAGMGSGQHKPSQDDYDVCRSCGTVHPHADGPREEIDVYDEEGRKSSSCKRTEETCTNKESHRPRGRALKPEWPGGYPAIIDDPVEFADEEAATEVECADEEEQAEESDDSYDYQDDEYGGYW